MEALEDVAPAPAAAAAAPETARRRRRLAGLQETETAKAVGLAAATMAQQFLGVAFTVVFTRLLGADGYGSLAALVNLTIILFVPGAALQVAAAREGTLGRLGDSAELSATLDRWTRHLLIGMVGVAAVSIVARAPLAALINVDEEWAAAAVPVTGAIWLLLCVQRGLLQAARAYRPVALSIVLEGIGRLAVGLLFVGVGLSVTGAYLGTAASLAGASVVLWVVLRRRLGAPAKGAPEHPLTRLARDAAVPIAGLVLVAALQNVDVIMAKHTLDEDTAGVYAAATVAAKAIVWIAVGLGLWVLPEATRRAAEGRDPRVVLARALMLISALAACALAIFAAVPGLLLRIAFGEEFERGDEVLLILGGAFSLLACTYLGVQYLLGLHRRGFVVALAVAAVAEPLLLAGADDLKTFAYTLLAVQAVAMVVVLAAAVFSRGRAGAGAARAEQRARRTA